MNKPVIAITPSHNTDNDDISLRPTYLRAITAAGGLPILLPLEGSEKDWEQAASLFDGFLFSGGPDPHPFLFGEETHACCHNVSAARDQMETCLLKAVMARQKPILGICRGIQIINVALGGDIYQDISSQAEGEFPIAHSQPFSYTYPSHHVTVVHNSLLEQITDHQLLLNVNSSHHQAVRRLAPGLRACAHSCDGLTEALEKPDYPFLLAVQWHPEYLWDRETHAQKLFRHFVDTCRNCHFPSS